MAKQGKAGESDGGVMSIVLKMEEQNKERDKDIESMKETIKNKFLETDAKIDALGSRMDVMEERMEKIETSMDKLRIDILAAINGSKGADAKIEPSDTEHATQESKPESQALKPEPQVPKPNPKEPEPVEDAVGASETMDKIDEGERIVRIEAAVEQATTPYDPELIYETLVDPFQRTKEELQRFGMIACKFYSEGSCVDVLDMFASDFCFWTSNHLALISKDMLMQIRDMLKDKGANIKKSQGRRITHELARYLEGVRLERRQTEAARGTSYVGESSGGRCETYMDGASNRHQIIQQPTAHDWNDRRNRNNRTDLRTGILDADRGMSARQNADVNHSPIHRRSSDGPRAIERIGSDGRQSNHSHGRPSDVSKLFAREMKYSGGPMEPLQRRYGSFKDACRLSDIDIHDTSVVFPLLKTTFLRGAAHIYFTDVVESQARSVSEAIELLEKQFLNIRTRRVNDSQWHELSFKFVKSKREFDGKSTSYADVLSDLLNQISELADMRTGPGSETVSASKIIESVRGVSDFDGIVSNPPSDLQALNAALRSRALEVDRAMIRSAAMSTERTFMAHGDSPDGTMDEFASYFVDRFIKSNNRTGRNGPSRVRGYGYPRGSSVDYPRGRFDRRGRTSFPRRGNMSSRPSRSIPRDVCIICWKKGCHSSMHREAAEYGNRAARQYVAEMSDEHADQDHQDDDDGSGNVDGENVIGEDDESTASGYFISQARALVAMGLSHSDIDFVIDAIMLDTGSSRLSTVGSKFVQAVIIASVNRTTFNRSVSRKIVGIGGVIQTLGVIMFSFFFGERIYTIDVHVLPGTSPFILSHRDLD